MNLGIDVGGTAIKYGLVDENYNITSLDKVSTPKTKEEFITQLVKIINKFPNAKGIGISMPGIINSSTGNLITVGAIKGLDGINLIETIKSYGELRPVHIENDAKCVAISEMVCGNAVGISNFACITIGTGIGGGIVVDGKLVKGNNFIAGEIGEMRQELYSDQKLSDTSAILPIRRLYAEKHNLDVANVDGKLALTDPEIKEYFLKNIQRLIHNIVYILNPEKILIGGAISNDDQFIKKLQTNVEKNNIDQFIDYTIDKCKNTNNAGIIGAVHELLQSKII